MLHRSRVCLVLAALAATAAVALAASPPTGTVTYTLPVAYTDGTVLPATDIDHTTISWLNAAGASQSLTVKGQATTAQIPAGVCGTVNVNATVTTTATAVYPNATSAAAGPVPYITGVSCLPNPPGALVVQSSGVSATAVKPAASK